MPPTWAEAAPADTGAQPALDRPIGEIRVDLRQIAALVAPGSRVLDIGCGDGALMAHLVQQKGVDARGIELSQEGVRHGVSQGLSVVQGDADTDLGYYPAKAFDTAILSQTLQATRNPRLVLHEMVRIGHRAIVSFPNFGYWRLRLGLLAHGRMPVSPTLPDNWWDTPNIHLCTVRDFVDLCDRDGIRIEHSFARFRRGDLRPFDGRRHRANLLAELAIFQLSQA